MSKLNKIIEDTFCRDYKMGLSTQAISMLYGFYPTSIKRILNRKGIKLRENTSSRIVLNNPFEDLSREQVQYWLGYIASDGNLSKAGPKYRINISTNENSGAHLKKYCEFIGNNLIKVRGYFNKHYSCMEYSVNFCSKPVHTYLCMLGITPSKSLNLEMKIPLTWDFIRGVFDGDGCVSIINKSLTNVGKPRLSIATCSKKFKNQLVKFFKFYGLRPTVTINKCNQLRKNCLYSVNLCKFADVKKAYYYLYKNATVFLERKQLKFGLTLQECKDEITL